jgi:hypothetical protein
MKENLKRTPYEQNCSKIITKKVLKTETRKVRNEEIAPEICRQNGLNWAYWHMPVILALGSPRHKDHEFVVSLGYIIFSKKTNKSYTDLVKIIIS